MKEKKNIDRLFQEQLKNFEDTPNDQVWLNIEAELKKDKKKRRLIPLWLQYSGIAAALVLGLFMLKSVFQNDLRSTSTTIVINQDSTVIQKTNPPSLKETIEINPEEALANDEGKPSKNNVNQNSLNTNTQKDKAKTAINNKNSQNVITNGIVPQQNVKLAVNKSGTDQSKNAIKATQNKDLQEQIKNPNTVQQSSALAQNNTETKQAFKTPISNEKDNNNLVVTDKPIANTPKSEMDAGIQKEKNELEEILKNNTESKSKMASVSKNKWQITPNIAPVYLNTSSGGSAIDSQFSEKEKKAEKSNSYGLGIRYAINSKFTIRTGINKVALDYNTNDISYSPGLMASSIATINYSPNNAVEFKNEETYNTLTSAEKNMQKTTIGAINQKMGYYELPLEVSYALLDKKFGISLIGGFSTLFLNENKISLVSSQSNIELGEANNLNKTHLSSNFGIGFRYELIPSIQLHFEPTIKYQINTFSSNSNNFNPFFMGLYSGVSYRF